MKIFVNWDEREIISEKEVSEAIEEKAIELTKDNCLFRDFLERELYTDEIFRIMDDAGKETLWSRFVGECRDDAETRFCEEFEEIEILTE